MKNNLLKKIKLIFGVSLFLVAISVNVISSNAFALKFGYSSLAEIFNVAVASAEDATSCNCSGGTGASSCSCDGAIATVQWGCSVECGSAYYACCTNDACTCIPKPS